MKFRTAFPGSRQTKRISTGGGAPVVGIVCMNQELGDADTLSVGIDLQPLMLNLTARGLGTCTQVLLVAYPDQ